MAHSKWLACLVVDVQPHMGNLYQPEDQTSTQTIFDVGKLVLAGWLTNQLIHMPDSVMAIELLGSSTEEPDHGCQNHRLQHADWIELGLGMDLVSVQQLDMLDVLEVAETQVDVDLRGALTVGSELIWDRYCINKRLQFGKQITIITSLANNPAFRELDWRQYASSLPEAARKHLVNIYAHGAKAPRMIPSTVTIGKRTMDPVLHQNELVYVNWWTHICDEFERNGTWEDHEGVQHEDPPPYKAASPADLNRWAASNYDRDALSYILYYDFNYHRYTTQSDMTEEEEAQAELLALHELILTSICAQTGGAFHSYTTGLAEFNGPFHREKKTMTKYKGKLNLGSGEVPSLIDIAGFTYTTQAKIPTLSSWNRNPDRGGLADRPEDVSNFMESNPEWKPGDKVLPNQDPATHPEKITRERTYADGQGTIIPKEELLLGWRYGKEDIVPIDQDVLARVNYSTSKSLQILYTMKQDSIDPWIRTSSVDYFQGQVDNPQSQMAMNTLASYCIEKRLVLVVRSVRRDNTQPHLGYLSPHMRMVEGVQVGGFFFNKLPWQDDLRPNSNHNTIFVPLSDVEVQSWKAWYDSYINTYLQPHRTDWEKKRGQYVGDADAPTTFDEYVERLWIDQYKAQLAKLHAAVDSSEDDNDVADDVVVPLINPKALLADFDDVMNHKRWAIRNRTPRGFNSAYISPLSNNVILQDLPFWGFSQDTLTDNQKKLKTIADQMMLPEDYNPTNIHNPGLNRFYGAVKDRLMDAERTISDSMRYVEKNLLPPEPPLPDEVLQDPNAAVDPNFLINHQAIHRESIAANIKTLLGEVSDVREVEIETALVDAKGRKQWINPYAQAAADAQFNAYMLSTNNNIPLEDSLGLGAPGVGAGVKDEGEGLGQVAKEEASIMINPVDLGINVQIAWSANDVAAVGEENPSRDALKLVTQGKVAEALRGLVRVAQSLFFHGFTSPTEKSKSADLAKNRALRALLSLRDHSVEENSPEFFNDCMTFLSETAQRRDQLAYLQQQQEVFQLYPGSYQYPFPGQSDRLYVKHPLVVEAEMEQGDVKRQLSLLEPLSKAYPITDEKIEALTPFARYWNDTILQQWQDALALIDQSESDKSPFTPEQRRLPFLPNQLIVTWQDYDAERLRIYKEQNRQPEPQQQQDAMDDAPAPDNSAFDLAQYEASMRNNQQQFVQTDNNADYWNDDGYDDDYDGDLDFA